MAELSSDGLSVKGEPRKALEPWSIPENWQVECECLEAPKLLFRDGYYYLKRCGGRYFRPSTSHMVLSARSRNIVGPWEWSPNNPIVHTHSKNEKWWSKGHGRLVDAQRWFVVDDSPFLSKRVANSGKTDFAAPGVLDCRWLVRSAGWHHGRDPIPKAHLEPEFATRYHFQFFRQDS